MSDFKHVNDLREEDIAEMNEANAIIAEDLRRRIAKLLIEFRDVTGERYAPIPIKAYLVSVYWRATGTLKEFRLLSKHEDADKYKKTIERECGFEHSPLHVEIQTVVVEDRV